MDFEQKNNMGRNEENYHIENLRLVREFSKELILEMKSLVKSIVLFGSNNKNTMTKNSDIDIMIVLDNISVFVSDELREAYNIIVNKLVSNNSSKFHIMTVNLSDLWDMARKGDPVFVNILRHGVCIFDTNLIEAMQYLLEIGKIRPSFETVNNYMARSEVLLDETKKHLQDAILDLYYSVVDMVHATLMIKKQMPPSPKDMPRIFKDVFKKEKIVSFSKVIDEFYKIAKDIEHGKVQNIDGKYYDELKKKAFDLVKTFKNYNQEELRKMNTFDL